MISKEIEFCMQDMRNAACTGRISLDSQVRAYDLLDRLMSLPQGVYDLLPSAQEFCQTYESLADSLEAAYDEQSLLDEARMSASGYEELLRQSELRAKAGFRLESDRIGNYVAKTFDLMNEARMAYAGAQQALFAANVSYKVRAGIYADMYKYMQGK